jgi:hypothetical protein
VLRDNLIQEVNFIERSNLAFQFISYWLHCITNEHFDRWNNSIKSIAIKIEESQKVRVVIEEYIVLIIIHFDAYSCLFLLCHIYCLIF